MYATDPLHECASPHLKPCAAFVMITLRSFWSKSIAPQWPLISRTHSGLTRAFVRVPLKSWRRCTFDAHRWLRNSTTRKVKLRSWRRCWNNKARGISTGPGQRHRRRLGRQHALTRTPWADGNLRTFLFAGGACPAAVRSLARSSMRRWAGARWRWCLPRPLPRKQSHARTHAGCRTRGRGVTGRMARIITRRHSRCVFCASLCACVGERAERGGGVPRSARPWCGTAARFGTAPAGCP